MEGRVLTLRKSIVRRGTAALVVWCLLATVLPIEAATAEEGIPAGNGAVITAGAPVAVRAAPGWDAAVSYEIANGSPVTVWDVAQAAPDGSLWYPVDGGFVPVDAVSSNATPAGDTALYQDATQDATTQDTATDDAVAPAAADSLVTDAAPSDQGGEPAATEPAGDPVALESAPDSTSKEALAAPIAAADPALDAGTDLASGNPAATGEVTPVTGESVDPASGTDVTATAVDATPSATPAPPTTLGTGGIEPWGEPIATAYIAGTGGDGAPCLTAPDWGSATLTVLGEGEAVPVRAETQGEWQPVDCAGSGGYVNASLIAWSQMAAPEDRDNGGQKEGGSGGGGGGSDGSKIVDFALRYEGHPYVYAGEGPKAFDCSGFTMFVIQKTLGIDITHDMHVQYDMGTPVGRNALKPGDLVFFKNTYEHGMSHTGIYIGDGQFIHAENESTGVRISELDSDYYSSHWYGAVRYT